MKSIKTEIIINATPSTVWNILSNFEDYKNWNPFIHIDGELKEGQQLKNTIYLEGQSPQVFKPNLTKVEEGKSFRWVGRLFVKGLFDGEHYFVLEPFGKSQTKLIHGENFSGVLSGVLLKMIGEKTKAGFEKMNMALKNLAEAKS